MSKSKEQACIILAVAILGGAFCQVAAKREAALLGLSALELGLLGSGAAAFVARHIA